MFDTLIARVIAVHPDFTYEEVEMFCQDFIDSIQEKMKEETKLKRLTKYLEKEFELDGIQTQKSDTGVYSLETIPTYLMSGKPEITSSLVTITDLVKNIEQTELFDHVDLQVGRTDKIALIGKNGAGKTTLLKMMIGRDTEYDGQIELAKGLKIGYLSQDLFWNDPKNTLRAEMLQVFPEITEKIDRLAEIISDDEVWEEVDQIQTFLRENDGYRHYDLQTDILKYF